VTTPGSKIPEGVALLEAIPVPLFVIDLEHRVTIWNRALARLTAVPAELVLGKPEAWRAVYPEARPCLADLVLDGAEDEIPRKYRGRALVRKHSEAFEIVDFFPALAEGRGAWLRFSAITLRDDDGAIVGALQTIEEVTEACRAAELAIKVNHLKERLFSTGPLQDKLKVATDGLVELLDADFARIWIAEEGDLCDVGCPHASATEEKHLCRDHDLCLHLLASSGRFTHLDGGHARVPFGCYKIGRVASGDERSFVTNDVTQDPRVHDRSWAARLGLVSFAGCRLLNTEGKPIGVLALFSKHPIDDADQAIIEDLADTVSQAVFTHKALEESWQLLADIVQGTPAPLFVVGKDRRVLFWNKAMAELTGTPSSAVVGTRDQWRAFYPAERPCLADLIVDDASDQIQELYRGKFQRSSLSAIAYEAIDFFPSVRGGAWLRFTASSLRDARGRLAGAIETVEDITERKRVEDALRLSEERYRLIAENIADVIWTVDLSLRFSYISPSVHRLRGLTVEEAMAQRLEEVLTPESLARVQQLFAEEMPRIAQGLLDPARVITIQLEEYRKDGSTVWTENELAFLCDDEKRVIGIVGVTHDITARRRAEEERAKLEEQLRHSQKMEAVGRLAGGVAHDFNNSLTSITLSTEILLESHSPLDPSYQDLLEIKRAAERSSALTAQLLAFSRRQIINPRVTDLNTLLLDSSAMLRRLVGEDVELRFLPGESLGRVNVDLGQVEQILANLVVNARDAMPDGGCLTVETANVSIDDEYRRRSPDATAGEYVMVAVSDDGAGIPEDVVGHIFEPFFTTKEKGKGTGLGLSMVYGGVRQNGGFVNVYSELGVGTTFKIYFPRVHEALELPTSASSQAANPMGTETILLVEDEEAVRVLAKRVLEKHGYRVLSVDRGGDAFLLCSEGNERIDLLITDVVLPGMNGLALYTRLQELRPELKVLFMSGYTENVVAHHGVLDKDTHFIPKPFTIQKFLHTVREILDKP
jgi:two-component system, cell cycle sensor histidine kinase and response regulator CckA